MSEQVSEKNKGERNPFKDWFEGDELPSDHKKGVLTTIDTAKFLMEIADLFTLKQAATNGTILHTILDPNPKKRNRK